MADTKSSSRKSQTSEMLTERGRGSAERIILGDNPTATMLRVGTFVLLFVLVFGTLFYFANQ